MATASSPLYYILIAFLISSASLFTICRASRGGGRREIVYVTYFLSISKLGVLSQIKCHIKALSSIKDKRPLKPRSPTTKGEAPNPKVPLKAFYISISEKEVSFAYTDDTKGPNKWGTLKPEWKTCGNGKSQSPIDLVNGKVQVQESLGPLKITHKAAPAKISNRGGMGRRCRNYALEGHIVHKSADEGIAVIGILYNVGNADPFLSKVLKNIKTVTEEGTDLGSINPNDITFDRNAYYRYTGSLTTPPCTEGVIWTVIKTVRTASAEQVNALKAAVYDGFQKNARPIQNVQGRTINLSSKN
ncbi:hypothetical protein Leryth_027255 [Lithospermum erythrorhizon]|nr:hypothetical protein Leryth_027255 [Lithospermum erythrorhizon]